MDISKKQFVLGIKPTKDKAIDNILLINNEKELLVSFKNYGFIYIYNLTTFEIKSKIKFPNESKSITYNIQLKDKRLAHSSHDKNVYITKQKTNNEYVIDEILKGHDGIILKVIQLQNEQICSCSHDKTIKIWEKNENKKFVLKHNLRDSNECFFSVIEITENIIASTSCDMDEIEEVNQQFCKFWKINEQKSFNFISSNSICLWNNNFIKINKNYFAISGTNKIIIILFENEKSIKTNIFSFEGGYYLTIFKMKNNNFLISNSNGSVFELKFNNETFEDVAIKKNIHSDFVTSFAELNNGILFSASDDGTIKIFI